MPLGVSVSPLGKVDPAVLVHVTGVRAGTPTIVILSDDFTIRATDANGCFAELNYKIAILAGVPTLPQLFIWMLALTLIGLGYLQLRRRQRLNRD